MKPTLTLFIGVIAAAIVGSLIEYLLGIILPEKPKLKHLTAVSVAVIVFGFITVLLPQLNEDTSSVKLPSPPIVQQRRVSVPANQYWYNTGITVNQGDY